MLYRLVDLNERSDSHMHLDHLVKNTTDIRLDVIFYDYKLHVSASIGHLQVSTSL